MLHPHTRYLANLTPLRGIAAILTVIFHVDLMIGNGGGMLIPFDVSELLTKFYLMVDFFFVLSGFIMSHVYTEWFARAVAAPAFRKFTLARFARIYPLHFVTLAFLVLFRIVFFLVGGVDTSLITNSCFTWISVPTNLLLIQSMNVHNWYSWNNAAWSISTEWWMYMLFPFLVRPFLALKSAGRIGVLLGCVAGYLFIMFVVQHWVTHPPALFFIHQHTDINVTYQFGFLRCAIGFLMGMTFYRFYRDGDGQRFFGNGYTLVGLTVGLLLSMHFTLPDVVTVCFFPLIILSAAYSSPGIDRAFSGRVMQRLGDWSYSIYLTHQVLLFSLFMTLDLIHPQKPGAPAGMPPPIPVVTGWLYALLFVAATLLVSYLTYTYIEGPARRWITRKFIKPDAGQTLTAQPAG